MRWLLRLLALALVLYLLSGITQVRPEEQAVVRRFGRFVDRWGPGLHLGLPYGLDRVDRIPVSAVRQVNIGYNTNLDYQPSLPPGQLLTADQNLMNLQVAVEYFVRTDPGALEDYVLKRDRVDALLSLSVETLMTEWVASVPVDTVLRSGSVALPAWLMQRLPERIAPYQLGIEIQQASVALLAPPDEVKDAFEAVNQAQSQMLTREYEARQQADRRQATAQEVAFRERQRAAAYQAEQRALARAEVEAFRQRLRQYQQLRSLNPKILASIWWNEMGSLLTAMQRNGRIDLLDTYLDQGGLDITQFLPPK